MSVSDLLSTRALVRDLLVLHGWVVFYQDLAQSDHYHPTDRYAAALRAAHAVEAEAKAKLLLIEAIRRTRPT